ncbi:hypothetical protein FACS1894170_05700 [Planctomycetales bacterium]|nr:hypothetical protein FACS1894170_05700 [Planctomycetales bacterium]
MFHSEQHIQCLGFLGFFVLGCGQEVPVAVESADVSAVSVQPVSSIKTPEPPMMPLDPAKIVPVQKLPTRKGLAAIGSAMHDFGDIQQKTELRHDFVLTNESDVPIRIAGMQKSKKK